MPQKKTNKDYTSKVSRYAGGQEVIKIDLGRNVKPDHRDRPDNQYPEEFKRRVALAASVKGVKLTWVGLRFNVLPETVRTWYEKYKKF